MTVHAKQQLVSEVENDIGEFLTVVNTKGVIQSLSNRLNGYSVELLDTEYEAKNDDILKAFIEAKSVEGRSEKTLNRYSYMLEKMLSEMGKPAAKVNANDIRAYLANERERGLSGRSLEGVRQIMSTFFNWTVREGLISKNPMSNIGAIKFKKDIKLPFSSLEIEMLKQGCETDRDRALVDFLLSTGCRIGEVCRLKTESIDFQRLELTVLGKGNKERVVYLTEVAAASLKKYLSGRTDNDDHLFTGTRGPLTPQGVRFLFTQLSKRSGVPNVHPHRFRRTLATHLIDRGMPIQEVAYVLGHSNLNTTMTYVYIEKSNVKASYRRYSN